MYEHDVPRDDKLLAPSGHPATTVREQEPAKGLPPPLSSAFAHEGGRVGCLVAGMNRRDRYSSAAGLI